jgi:hypothetical protein
MIQWFIVTYFLVEKMPVTTGKYGPLVGAIDEGTSSARFLVSYKFQTIPHNH